MKRLLLLALLPCMLLSACMQPPRVNALSRSWKFKHITNENILYSNDSSSVMIDSLRKRLDMGYLSLYGDNRYTFLGIYISSMGSWHFNEADSTISIDSFYNTLPVKFQLEKVTDEVLRMYAVSLGTHKIDGSENSFLFIYDPHFEEGHVDLLTADRNSWRMRPTHRESPGQIRARVKKHVDYLADYFQMVKDKKRTYFEPGYLQSAVRFCRDGVGVESEQYLSDKWIACFYDREDALKGRQILVDAVNASGKYPEAEMSFTDAYLIVVMKMKAYMDKNS